MTVTQKQHHGSLHNYMLLSMPQLHTGPFKRSVVCLCEHSHKGAMGLIINHTHQVAFADMLPQLNITEDLANNLEQPIFTGGPIKPDHGFVLHTPLPNKNWQSSVKMANNLCLTTSVDVINDIAHSNGPEHSLIALGYAGWGPGQLEQEIANNTWLCCPFDANILFNTPPAHRFHAAARLLGIDINLLSTQVGHG
jgi:putative transcriptional regulator